MLARPGLAAVLLLGVACGRGIYGTPPAPAVGSGGDGVAGGGVAPSLPDASAPDVSRGGAEGGTDAGPGAERPAITPMFPAGTTWSSCGELGAPVTALAHSPDGRWLAAGHADGRVNVMQTSDGQVAARIEVRHGPIVQLAFDKAGTMLAVFDGSLQLYGVPDGKHLREVDSNGCGGTSLQFGAGEVPLLLAAGELLSGNDNIKVFRGTDFRPVGSFEGGSIARLADGDAAVFHVEPTTGRAAAVTLEGRPIRTVRLAVSASVKGVSPDGTLVAAEDDSTGARRVAVMSARDGRLLWRSDVEIPWVQSVLFLPRLQRVLVVGTELELLDGASGKRVAAVTGVSEPVLVDAAPDGQSLGVFGKDGRLLRFATDGSGQRPVDSGEFGITDELLALAASPDGRHLAASAFGLTWVFDLTGRALVHRFAGEGAWKPVFSPDGKELALAGDARVVFRLSDGEVVTQVAPEFSYDGFCWPGLVFSRDGTTLASGSCGKVELYDRAGRRIAHRASMARAPGVTFSPDGMRLGTTGPELWSADPASPGWLMGPPPKNPGREDFALMDDTAAFSPDGTLLLVSTAVREAGGSPTWHTATSLISAADGRVVRSLGGELARRPSFSPDGEWIVAGTDLIHVASNARARLGGQLSMATFLPDGRIVGAGKDAGPEKYPMLRLFCPVGR